VSGKIYFPRSVQDQTIFPREQAGRKITAGLTVFNRAGRGTISRVWLPTPIMQDFDRASAHEFKVDWVAVREVDIARQYGNFMIYDMVMEEFNRMKWTHFDHSRMTDDGYRMIFVTMGTYEKPETCAAGDELKIFDEELRERVQQIVSIMWDNERGALAGDMLTRQLWFKGWDERRIAADIAISLAGAEMFHGTKDWASTRFKDNSAMDGWHKYNFVGRKLNFELTKKFLQAVAALQQHHFHSDQVMFGIELPEFKKINQWIYLADPENKIYLFNNIIAAIYDKFDMTSLAQVYGKQPTVHHLPTWRNRERVRHIDQIPEMFTRTRA
jgi:hypothetical protein